MNTEKTGILPSLMTAGLGIEKKRGKYVSDGDRCRATTSKRRLIINIKDVRKSYEQIKTFNLVFARSEYNPSD